MKSFDPRHHISRRSAISALASTVVISGIPTASLAQSGQELHLDVVAKIRSFLDGKSTTLQLLLPNGSGGNVGPVVAAFEEMTGVKVVVSETQVDEINTELLLDALSQNLKYDVALPATFGLPDLVDSGAIRAITDFATKHEPVGFRDDILFGIGDTFDGETYGFQTDGDAYLMFYNKALLEHPDEQMRFEDTFGKPLRIAETWEDLDQQMAFFNRPDDGLWGGLLFRTAGYLAWEWWVRFHAKGVWPFSTEMEPQIAGDEGVAALEEMIKATAHLCPEAATLGLFENWERFGRGDVFCNIGWGGSQKYLMGDQSTMRGNMVYGQTPGGMIDGRLLKTPYFNWGWNYVVAQTSQQPELAYLFALFASSPVMSTLAVRQTDGFFDPYRPEHYDDMQIQAVYTPEFLEVQRESLVSAIPDLYLRDQGEYFRVLTEWLTRALAGDISPKAALERVARHWRLITNGADKVQQAARWHNLRSKYPLDLQARLRDN